MLRSISGLVYKGHQTISIIHKTNTTNSTRFYNSSDQRLWNRSLGLRLVQLWQNSDQSCCCSNESNLPWENEMLMLRRGSTIQHWNKQKDKIIIPGGSQARSWACTMGFKLCEGRKPAVWKSYGLRCHGFLQVSLKSKQKLFTHF